MDGGQLEPAKKSVMCEENRLRNTHMPSKEDFMCGVEDSEGAQDLYANIISVFTNVPWLEPGKAPQRFEGMTSSELELLDGARARTVASVARAATGRQQVAASAAAARSAAEAEAEAEGARLSSPPAPRRSGANGRGGMQCVAGSPHQEYARIRESAKNDSLRVRQYVAALNNGGPPFTDAEGAATFIANTVDRAWRDLLKAEVKGETPPVLQRLLAKLLEAKENLRVAEEDLRAQVVRRRARAAGRATAESLAAIVVGAVGGAPKDGADDGEHGADDGEHGADNGKGANDGESDDDERSLRDGEYPFQENEDGSQVSNDDIMTAQEGLGR